MDRARVIFGHLHHRQASGDRRPPSAGPATPSALAPAPVSARGSGMGWDDDDVVICAAKRTPICKARRGGFKDTLPEDLLTAVFTAVIDSVGLDPTLIGDICVGNVLQPGAGAVSARFSQFFANIPETVPLMTVNRQCSSGLQACMNIAAAIKAGTINIGIGAGMETMSVHSKRDGVQPGFVLNPNVMENDKARDCLIPMGITSENVAERFGITREEQDQMGFESQKKAAKAQAEGRFNAEIVPIQTILRGKDGNEQPVTIKADDGIRANTNLEGLAKLRPAFQEGGSTTAGNSSQVSDGAAAVILARRSAARRHNLPIMGVLRSYAVVGVPPDVMGIGPAYAIPEALKKAGLSLSDIDIFEINEAFASQATYCVKKLGIPMEKVNPNGGAIALGHPLGCTGARQVATLLHEFKRRGKRGYGVISMCIGTGMGAAAVVEYPGPPS